MSGLPSDQHMARVNLSESRWLEFRALAIRNKRSIASYLGHLVQKELARAERVEWRRPHRAEERLQQEAAQGDETWVPPWEI